MLKMEKTPNFYNQLNFNLDADSPASNISGPYTPPPFIFVQKFPKKTNALFGRDDQHIRVPVKSDRLALAVQLAKLDMSNSQLPSHPPPKVCDKTCKERKPKTKIVLSNPTRNKESRMLNKPNVQTRATNTNKRFYNNNTPNKSHKNAHASFMPVKRNIGFQKPIFHKKDAHTSTSDLDRQFSSLFDVPNTKPAQKPNQSFIKKERLKKQFNQLPAHKSGYLSQYRSPSRRKDRRIRFNKPFAVIPKPRNHFQPKKAFSPNSASSKGPDHQMPAVDYTTDTSSFCSYESSKNDISCITPGASTQDEISERVNLNYPRRCNQQKFVNYPYNAEPSCKHKGTEDILNLTQYDDKYNTNPLESTQHDDGSVAVNEIRNAPTYETLLQRLADIENSEKMIRHRWRKIKYDNIATHQSEGYGLDLIRSSDSENILSSNAIHINGGKDSSFVQPRKEIVRFVQPKTVPNNINSAESSSVSHCRKKLCLSQDTINSIEKNKSEFQRYLHLVFHEPKGKFNPWKLVKELSNEIVGNIINDVCDEVNDGFEGYVEQLFEDEFAEPNYSMSTADSSHHFSTFDHGKSPC